jgi:hypothetical protein
VSARTIVGSAAIAARHALAERHVKQGRCIVERQQKIIAEKKAAHLDTSASEQLLSQFLISQKIFEDELASLTKAGGC